MAFAHGWISKVISSNDDLFGKKMKILYAYKCTLKRKGRQEQEGKVEEEEEENNRKMR